MEMDGNINPRGVFFFCHPAFILLSALTFSHPLTFMCEPFAATGLVVQEVAASGQEQVEAAE